MEWLRIMIRRTTLLRAVAALLFSSTARHEEARKEEDSERSASLRQEADADADAHNELWRVSHYHETGNLMSFPTIYNPSMARAREHSSAAAGGNATGGNASVTGVSPALLWVNTLISSVALCAALVSGAMAWWEAKEVKQLQIQVMYSNALLLRAGIMLPGDFTYGPEGNLEYRPKSPPKQQEK